MSKEEAMQSRTYAIEDSILAALADDKMPVLTKADLLDLVRHIRTYRDMATHFADILAATAEDLLSKKSTSKSERARQASIVLHTLSDLKHEVATSRPIRRGRQSVLERLQGVIDRQGRPGDRPSAPEPQRGA